MNKPFVLEKILRCPADHAFATFTSKVDLWWPKTHRRFAQSMFTFDAVIGGQLIERGSDGAEMLFGEVLAVNPPNEIRLAWHPGKNDRPTDVTITFEQSGDETLVRVFHQEGDSALGADWPQRVALFSGGWVAVMDALATHTQTNS